MKKNYQRVLVMTAMVLAAAGTTLYASEADTRIETAFKDSYVAQNFLQNEAVKATSSNGIVTVSGTINQPSHKNLAQETAKNIPGVSSVDNRLEMNTGQPAEKSNEWLAMNIKAALLFHRNVSVMNTQVYVEEGIVTLRGEADSQAQKELTAEYAAIDGVKEVRNEMTVAKAEKEDQTMKEKIDDASITAQVKVALLVHRATSGLKTSVATKDGVVTLGGKAANAAEKDLAAKLVTDIHGVNSVVNNMTV